MTVPSWARVGAKVICVNVEILPHQKASTYRRSSLDQLKVGATYTISGIGHASTGRPGLWLAEASCTWKWKDGREAGFDMTRFRPIVTRTQEQDVRTIKSMLRDMPAESRLDRLLEELNE